MRVLVPAVLLALVASSTAAARDIVVFDRGGGAPRTRAVRAAFSAGGDTVLDEAETAALDRDWAARCTDAACYARAGVAGSVALIVLVEPGRLVAVDVATSERARPVATEADLASAIAALQHPEAFGTLLLDALDPGTVVLVDGQPFAGGELPIGRHVVSVRPGPDATPIVTDVVIEPLTVTRLARPAAAPLPTTPAPPSTVAPTPPSSSTPTPLHPGFIVGGVGGGILVVGTVVAVVGEVLALDAVSKLQARQPADLRGAEAVLTAGVVVSVVGAATAAAGVVAALVLPSE